MLIDFMDQNHIRERMAVKSKAEMERRKKLKESKAKMGRGSLI